MLASFHGPINRASLHPPACPSRCLCPCLRLERSARGGAPSSLILQLLLWGWGDLGDLSVGLLNPSAIPNNRASISERLAVDATRRDWRRPDAEEPIKPPESLDILQRPLTIAIVVVADKAALPLRASGGDVTIHVAQELCDRTLVDHPLIENVLVDGVLINDTLDDEALDDMPHASAAAEPFTTPNHPTSDDGSDDSDNCDDDSDSNDNCDNDQNSHSDDNEGESQPSLAPSPEPPAEPAPNHADDPSADPPSADPPPAESQAQPPTGAPIASAHTAPFPRGPTRMNGSVQSLDRSHSPSADGAAAQSPYRRPRLHAYCPNLPYPPEQSCAEHRTNAPPQRQSLPYPAALVQPPPSGPDCRCSSHRPSYYTHKAMVTGCESSRGYPPSRTSSTTSSSSGPKKRTKPPGLERHVSFSDNVEAYDHKDWENRMEAVRLAKNSGNRQSIWKGIVGKAKQILHRD
ncbi:uncharacterized protein BJ171DRAFT_234309 [Polychytrium aggregatum]|uniref:uncharacterized protein n=1 Tax=Polychytrium aggregatum TaxID=110093 RepID=UPI0022FDD01C|nr:uncharacterized protein BJ171DRAFT_234309 [Polychytrium aggregatum]KAI9208097.1 hypothetical protein BJ171DRAFT_234309 [Polychytrium aggregatum]